MKNGELKRIGLTGLMVLGLCVPASAWAQAEDDTTEEATTEDEATTEEASTEDEATEEEATEEEATQEEGEAEESEVEAVEEDPDAIDEAPDAEGETPEPAPGPAPATAPTEAKTQGAPPTAPAATVPADADDGNEGDDAAEASAAPGKGKKKKDLGEDEDTAAALGAASPVVASNSGKPWQLMLSLSGNLGSSTFTSNQETAGGYSISFTGLYRLMPLFEGRLDALVRVAADQVIDEGFQRGLGATSPNQFFFRDTRIGLLGRGLYRSKTLGLTFGANTTLDLPTSEQAQFWGRIARWNVGGNVAEMLEGVGPGNLLLVLSASFRKDIGDVNPSVEQFSGSGNRISACRTSNQTDAGNCLTDLAPFNFAFIYGGSMRYFVGPVSFGLGLTFLSNFNHDLGDSALEGTLTSGTPAGDVGSSQFATDAPPHSLLMFTTVSATYVVNRYLNLSLGLNSFQSPIRYIGDNPRGLVAPFFDSPERGFTSAFLSASLMY